MDGNNKKGEAYWEDVVTNYNKNRPSDQKRSIKNYQDQW